MDIVKCRYKNCRHETRELNKADAAVVGKAYYHKDCYEEKETIERILKVYEERIDPYPIWVQVRGVINTIIYKKKVDPKFLLFAIQHSLNNGGKINSTYGLHYVVKDHRIIEAWEKRKREEARALISQAEFIAEDDLTPNTDFNFTPKTNSFAKVVGK